MPREVGITIGSLAPAKELTGAVDRLLKVAYLDPTTRLLNRSALASIAEAFDYSRPVAVIFLDLTGFKALNEALGHAGGDAGLIAAANRISEVAAEMEALAFRNGGDEFLVLVNPTRFDQCVGRLMADSARIEFVYEGERAQVTLCAGAAVPLEGEEDKRLDDFVKRAETACRMAKDGADGVCVVWDASHEHEAPVSRRMRCRPCGATTTLLVAPSRTRPDNLARCSNCGEPYVSA